MEERMMQNDNEELYEMGQNVPYLRLASHHFEHAIKSKAI